jgi:hypothetical protein
MKAIKILLILTGLAILFLAPGRAGADYTDTIMNNTYLQAWQGNVVNTGWSSSGLPNGWRYPNEPIGSTPSAWYIQKVSVTWTPTGNMEMKIYTNYPPGSGLESAGQGDIALDPTRSGNFSYGVDLNSLTPSLNVEYLANIYYKTTWQDSETFWGNGSWIYTGGYHVGPVSVSTIPLTPYTVIASGTYYGQATVEWLSGSGTGSNYVVDVMFPTGFNSSNYWNNFNFTVSSGSCANEIMAGNAAVPVPPSFLLLGSGLLGLGLLRYGKKGALSQEKISAGDR